MPHSRRCLKSNHKHVRILFSNVKVGDTGAGKYFVRSAISCRFGNKQCTIGCATKSADDMLPGKLPVRRPAFGLNAHKFRVRNMSALYYNPVASEHGTRVILFSRSAIRPLRDQRTNARSRICKSIRAGTKISAYTCINTNFWGAIDYPREMVDTYST